MKVLISDARYSNPETGEVIASKRYHYLDGPCLKGSSHSVEVEEEVAQQFGRSLCKTCQLRKEQQDKFREIERLLVEQALPSLEILARSLPDDFELRIYYWGDNKQPKKLWSSDGEV